MNAKIMVTLAYAAIVVGVLTLALLFWLVA
jgi:hypothetical protein